MTADWISALGDRAGPLAESARALASRRGCDGVPQGTEAIRLIADAIDELSHDPDAHDDDDRRLVEDAGALLGLVLVERFGGQHVRKDADHRVLLGSYGSFDPFAAIDATLDASDPAGKLRERIHSAETEGRGRGPIARVIRAFDASLTDRGVDLVIVGRFELELELSGGIEVDLRRVAEATEDLDDAAVRAATIKLVALLPGGDADHAHTPWSEARDRILPRLVGADFLESLGQQAGALHLRTLGHDVRTALQLRYEGRSRYARIDEVQRWRDEGALPHAQALQRLAERSNRARFEHVQSDQGVIIIARTGDGLDAARLLLPTLHGVLAAELDDPIFVAVPHRDTLLASSDAALLRHHAEDAAARAPHRISAAIFELQSEALVAI